MNSTKNIVSSLVASGLIAATTGCGNGSVSSGSNELFEEQIPVITRKVAAFKQECQWLFGFDLCLQGRADDSQEWRSTTMPGLDFKWGYEYSVQFRDIPVTDPLPDGPAYTRELLDVAELGPVAPDTEFDIAMRASDPLGPDDKSYITKTGPDSYMAYFNTAVVCSTPDICAQVDEIINQNQKFLGKFGFRPELDLPIVLKQVICVEENDDSILQCDKTMNLEVSSEVVDQFMQITDTFTTTEQIFAKFTLNNTGTSTIDIGYSLCTSVRVGYQIINGPNFPGRKPDECDIQGDSEVSLNANSQTILLVNLTALIADTIDFSLPADYVFSLKFYNQPTRKISISVR